MHGEDAVRGSDEAQILRARARILARPRDPETGDASLQLLEFRLGQERYGIETACIREVYGFKDLTPLPSTPPAVLGIVNVRGRMVPLFDLRRLFDMPVPGVSGGNQMIVVEGNGLELGLVTDEMAGLRLIESEALQPSLPTLAGRGADYLKGVTPDRLVVLDVARLLADPALIVHQNVNP